VIVPYPSEKESMGMRKLLVGLTAAGAVLGAGFGLAGAQTEPPATPAPDDGGGGRHDGRSCDKDGNGRPDAERTGFVET